MTENTDILNSDADSIMAAPFEYVEANASTEEISKKINKEQPAVLVKDMIGSTHIITQYDIINAIK